ncbi:transglutaminase-like domain-containing protein [Microbacterium luticocti]|uniref:transglutaminase-like domain-containing protein n=1 Tax=Microbacterium luticocti TaxID=451764 RepID=UPI00041F6722|nr:transglutaminase-like domain-containing protein [Microbacterium luticocti]
MNRAIAVVWAGCVLALSTVPIAAGYAAWWALPVLIGCVLVPTLLVVLGRALRIGAGWIALGVGALAVIAGIALGGVGVGDDPHWAGPGVLAPLVDAIPRLLTAPRPAPDAIGYLVPAGMLVWLVALGVALAVTARGRARMAPLIGLVLLQTAGALLTAGEADAHGLVAAASIALLLLGWVAIPAADADPRRSARPTRAAWAAAAIAAVVVGALALTGAALTAGDRFEPRALVPPPQLPAQATNPLPDVALWNTRADETLFTIAASPAPQRVRLAVLPDFDGAAWTLEGRLRQVGVVDKPDLPASTWRHTVTYRFEPGALTGAWVPSLGLAEQATGGVLMDADTGSLVASDGRADAPVTVTASVDAPSEDAVTRAGVPPESEASRYLQLPRVPTDLVDQAQALTAGADTPWAQVTALSDFVRGDRTLDQGAPSGASYGRLTEFLFASKADGGQVGTTEQFAASFAVLARAIGIPTRLVVGFDTGSDRPAGARTVFTGADARVWAEVYLSRAGWVTVDPSPDSAILTRHTPPAGDVAAAPTPTPAPSGAVPDAAPPAAAPVGARSGSTGAVLAVVAACVLVLLIVGIGMLVWLRVRRRLRWRSAGAPGAWAQVLDAAALAGVRIEPGMTPEQVARRVAEAAAGGGGVDDRDADAVGRGGRAGDSAGADVAGAGAGAARIGGGGGGGGGVVDDRDADAVGRGGRAGDTAGAVTGGAGVAGERHAGESTLAADALALAARAQRDAYAPAAGIGDPRREGAAPDPLAGPAPGHAAVAVLDAREQDEASADWAAALRIERALRRRAGWWRRLVWHVSPRVLGDGRR